MENKNNIKIARNKNIGLRESKLLFFWVIE
jgi:hypothetical protein